MSTSRDIRAIEITNRPSDLIYHENEEESFFLGNREGIGSERGALSPGICSDGSTSSVNVRQRKLSDCIVDWVFDDSDSCMMSDISEGPPPLLIDDGELFLL